MNAEEIITVVTGVIAAASVIANITPTQTDNVVLKVLGVVVNLLAVNLKQLREAAGKGETK